MVRGGTRRAAVALLAVATVALPLLACLMAFTPAHPSDRFRPVAAETRTSAGHGGACTASHEPVDDIRARHRTRTFLAPPAELPCATPAFRSDALPASAHDTYQRTARPAPARSAAALQVFRC